MKLERIVNKVASNLMPVGTVVERMITSFYLNIGDRIEVQEHYNDIFKDGKEAIFAKGHYFSPEAFRVVKEAK